MSKFRNLLIGAALVSGAVANPALAEKLGLGRQALPEEIEAWNKDVSPDGTGLPVGSGSVEDGDAIFADNCAICHGDFAEGVDNWPKLAGGMDTLNHKDPLKTVGSYWPHLTTAFDYVDRSMPFGNAQTLTPDEVYAVVAYILYSNDLVEDDFVLSNENLLEVEMPNAGGFIIDDRPVTEYPNFTEANACYENCKESVEVTMRAAVLDVTPEETRAKKVQELVRMTKPERTAAPAEEAAPAAEETAAAEQPAAEETPAEQPAAETPAEQPAAEAAPIDAALAAEGEKVFKKCKSCHQVGDGAKNRTGPVLNGVYGRAIGGADDFKYSDALKSHGGVWDQETLAGYLANPRQYIKGNKMSFAGLKKDDEIAAVIEYLRSFPAN
ncbi:MAG: c-type cytochrome [Roseivivax sp.]|nr:c-type cytochrome [Roseivivax sp.]